MLKVLLIPALDDSNIELIKKSCPDMNLLKVNKEDLTQEMIDEADVILFVVDVMNGVTDLDMEVAEILRRSKTPVLLVANKTDNNDLQYNAAEFYSLGLGDPYCVSALSGSGTGDLLDLIVSKFKKESDEIQVVTNLFIPKQTEYHIQLSGNYPEESEAWDKFLEENQWKIYPLLANIMQVFLPTGNYQLFYTQYPQGFISIIAKPHDK